MNQLLLFDMDGVLVDVTESYREAIQQTVESYSGTRPTPELIQDFKNRGGYNCDWRLSHQILADQGFTVEFDDVVTRFNELFLGKDNDGLVLRERWLPADGLLNRLAGRYRIGVYTGRHDFEIAPTLGRFGLNGFFDPVITADMVAKPKPAPDGILQAIQTCRPDRMWYVGDTVDDGIAARAAGVPFIGIAALSSPKRNELVCALQAAGAIAVITDINQLESVLPE